MLVIAQYQSQGKQVSGVEADGNRPIAQERSDGPNPACGCNRQGCIPEFQHVCAKAVCVGVRLRKRLSDGCQRGRGGMVALWRIVRHGASPGIHIPRVVVRMTSQIHDAGSTILLPAVEQPEPERLYGVGYWLVAEQLLKPSLDLDGIRLIVNLPQRLPNLVGIKGGTVVEQELHACLGIKFCTYGGPHYVVGIACI
jgi:hypothetical protein